MSYLKIEKLSKSFESHKILNGISICVKEGEFVSLLGPSGCGKTTTLRCIAGLERQDIGEGSISLREEVLSDSNVFLPPEKRQFGMVFQSYAVWPHLNVFDNVAFSFRVGGKLKTKNRDEIQDKVKQALEMVRLKGLESRFGHELSGGQQQRVALARALAMSPRLLLLDEPLSNLDILLREELRAEIQLLQKKLKMTTILVTHDQREALSLSDRIIIMNKGQIVAEGPPKSLYSSPPNSFVAEFLAGAQTVENSKGEKVQFIPRLWRVGLEASSIKGPITAKLYLGDEYEYWAELKDYKSRIKFYSKNDLVLNSEVSLTYAKNESEGGGNK